MKKLLILFLLLGSISLVAPSTNGAVSAAATAEPQIRVRLGQPRYRRWDRRARTYIRIVTIGRNRYRETVRVTYQPNGRAKTVVLNRVRIGRVY